MGLPLFDHRIRCRPRDTELDGCDENSKKIIAVRARIVAFVNYPLRVALCVDMKLEVSIWHRILRPQKLCSCVCTILCGATKMTNFRVACGVAAALITATGLAAFNGPARGADLSGPRERAGSNEFEQPASAPSRQFYVRGDLGIARIAPGAFSQADLAGNGGSFISSSIEDAPYIGVGLGWQLNPMFRLDLTAGYRATAGVRALDNIAAELEVPDGRLQANTAYEGNFRSYDLMVNGYWDLFSLRGFTPYVGAGIGLVHSQITGLTTASSATFTDAVTGEQTVQHSNGFSRAHSETNFAWALMAGTSFDISANGKLDIGYRYLNMGSGISASSDLLNCLCGSIGEPMKIADMDAHEFRIGLRWSLDGLTRPAEHDTLK